MNEACRVYTVWEENPEEIINMSKKQVLFEPSGDLDETAAARESEDKTQPADSTSAAEQQQEEYSSNATTESSSSTTSLSACEEVKLSSEGSDLLALPKSPKSPSSPHSTPSPVTVSPQSSAQSSPAKSSSSSSGTNRQPSSAANRQMYSYRVSATSDIKFSPKSFSSIKSGRPWHAVSKIPMKRATSFAKHKETPSLKSVEEATTKKGNKEKVEQTKEKSESSSPQVIKEEVKKEEKSIGNRDRSKYSSSELQTIQLRIKESLRQQGVVSSRNS